MGVSMMQENIFIEPFAERLTELREQKGVSAREMSLAIGQAHTFIHGIEQKRNFPQMLNFFYICEYLGVTPKEFFDYGQRTPAVDNDLYAEIQKLDAKSKEYYMNMIRETNKRPK